MKFLLEQGFVLSLEVRYHDTNRTHEICIGIPGQVYCGFKTLVEINGPKTKRAYRKNSTAY